jgi:hypothetical protein
MVGEEADPQVEPEQRLCDGHEHHGPQRAEEEEGRHEEEADVGGQQPGLGEGATVAAADEGHDAGHVQVEGLEEEQGDEEDGLDTGCHPAEPSEGPGLLGGVDEDAGGHVRVLVGAVGMGMVAVVLGQPPSEAEPGEQVGHHHPDQVVGPPAVADLTVACVVADEPQLGQHEGQPDRDRQVPPAVPDDHRHRHQGAEGSDRGPDLYGVVAAPPGKQPPLAHGP